MKLTTQDLLAITERFRTSYRDPHKPFTPEAKRAHDDAIARINAQFDLAPPIDVPEPILRAHDVYKYGSIVLAFFFCAIFASLIGEAIGHIAYALR